MKCLAGGEQGQTDGHDFRCLGEVGCLPFLLPGTVEPWDGWGGGLGGGGGVPQCIPYINFVLLSFFLQSLALI